MSKGTLTLLLMAALALNLYWCFTPPLKSADLLNSFVAGWISFLIYYLVAHDE